MSIALALTIVPALTGSIALLILVRRLKRGTRNSGCLSAVLAFPMLYVALLQPVVFAGKRSGFDLKRTDAVQKGFNIELPATASRIHFRQLFHQICDVDFSMTEIGFLEWCRQQKWTPVPISEQIHVTPLAKDNAIETRNIANGYAAVTHPAPDGRFDGRVIFDRDQDRAYYRYCSY